MIILFIIFTGKYRASLEIQWPPHPSNISNLERQLISSVLIHCEHMSFRGSQYLLFLDIHLFNCLGLNFYGCWCEISWYASRTFFQPILHPGDFWRITDSSMAVMSLFFFFCQGSDGPGNLPFLKQLRLACLIPVCLLPQLLSWVFPPKKILLVVGWGSITWQVFLVVLQWPLQQLLYLFASLFDKRTTLKLQTGLGR